MPDASERTPLSAATDGIRRMILASQGGETANACLDCQSPNSWCQCRRLAQAALDGLFKSYYEIRESR